ncbi:MAG TPA: hypothetical protein VFZ42_17340 [Chitinophagaceae bacterium]
MTDETLRALHLEGLMELLFQSTRELLEALERNSPDEIEIRTKKKQVQMLYDAILQKKESSKQNG